MQNPRFLAKDLSLQVTFYSGLEPCAMCPATAQEGMTYFEAVPDNILGCMWVVGCQDASELLL